MTTPIVLVHGGSFAGSCWDRMLPYVDGPVLAVDLPGRGAHPAALADVGIGVCARSIVADVDAAGFDDIVLAGHSLAGVSLPATIGLLGARVRHAVFVACTVPPDGVSSLDTLPEDFREFARTNLERADVGTLDRDVAKIVFGNDLDDEQFEWMMTIMTPEAPRLIIEPVDLAPLREHRMPRTWIRPIHDAILDPEKQLEFAANVGDCRVVDIDAAHMCMISQPKALASLLSAVATE